VRTKAAGEAVGIAVDTTPPDRLSWVVAHEVGHILDLEHCDRDGQDCGGYRLMHSDLNEWNERVSYKDCLKARKFGLLRVKRD
jgi:hypothetical protein